MIIVSGLSSIFQSRKVAFVSLLVLLGLLIVSVWDSVLIIGTYVNDNRITLVRTVDIGPNDTLPFLENLTFSFFYNASSFPDFSASLLTNSSVEEEITDGTFSLEKANMSRIDDRSRMLAIFDMIGMMDTEGSNCAGLRSLCADRNFMRPYSWLSNVTRNISLLENLEKQLWPFLERNLIANDLGIDLSDYFFADIPTAWGISAEIDTSRLLRGNKAMFGMIFDISNAQEIASNGNSHEMTLIISAKTTHVEPIFMSSVKHCMPQLKIENIGVFDKSQTTSCTNERNFITSTNARTITRAFLESMAEKCGCFPYTYKRHVRMFVGSMAADLAVCDAEAYVRCAGNDISMDDDNDLPSCVNTKNQYQLLQFCEDDIPMACIPGKDGEMVCGHSSLGIQSSADFYALYEERYQMTPTQFVGQLGGDIGLYTGLSILSIWQVLIYLYNKYSKFKSVYKHPSEESKSAASVRLMFYKAFVISLIKTIEESVVSVGQDDDHQRQGDEETGEKTVEQTLSETEMKLGCVEDLAMNSERLEAVEKEQEKTNQKLERLESIAMKLQRTLQDILKGKPDSSDEKKDHDEEADKILDAAPPHTADPDPTNAKFISSTQQKRMREFDHRLSGLENGQSRTILGMAAADHERRLTRIEVSQEKTMAILEKIAEKL